MLLTKEELDKLWVVRRNMTDTPDFVDGFLKKLADSKTNSEFLMSLDTIEEKSTPKPQQSRTSTGTGTGIKSSATTGRRPAPRTTHGS
jgi:transcription termination factor Rho